MKATIVLIADPAGENYGRSLMLEAHRAGNMGFEMARLPQHVSLKQPFVIPSLEEMEKFFDEFAASMHPISIRMEQMELTPNQSLGGVSSGCLSIRVEQSDELKGAQRKLFDALEKRFGPCPAEHDHDYVFHMTVAIGGAPFESYREAFGVLSEKKYNEEFRFGKLGLLYYDDDRILPGTYFCYKLAELK